MAQKGFKADYQGATPDLVASAILGVRADRPTLVSESTPGRIGQETDLLDFPSELREVIERSCDLGRRVLEEHQDY